MNINVTVPEGSTEIDVRAERCRTIFDKIDGGRAQWIDGTLELAAFVLEMRTDFPDHRVFSQWLDRHCLKKINKDDRTALLWMAENPIAARELLEQTKSTSWVVIYRTRPNRTLRKISKGPLSHQSGASKRKRAAVIPTVMRDDYVPGSVPRSAEPASRRRRAGRVQSPPPPERKAVSLRALTKEQVDPDFKGTHLEFITKYGHVNLHTKQELEYHKNQEALMAWIGLVSDGERGLRPLLAAAAPDPVTLREWMAKPAKAEKLRAWCDSIEQACKSISEIIASAKL